MIKKTNSNTMELFIMKLKKRIFGVFFTLLLVLSIIGSVSASAVPIDTLVWEVTASVNDCPHNWRVVIPMDYQKDPGGVYHFKLVNLNVKLDGYPKTVRGHYAIYLNESGHTFRLIQSGPLSWDYNSTRYDAVAVDDFIAHGYKGATWHFVLFGNKLILTDYYDAYLPKVPKNDTPVVQVPITNTTVPLSNEDTIPMQNTGMPLNLLVIALIIIIGTVLYSRK